MNIPPLWFTKLMIWLHVWCYTEGDGRHCDRCGWPSC